MLILEPGRRGGFAVGEPVRISGPTGYHEEFICTGLRDIKKKVEYIEYKLLKRGNPAPVTLTVRKGSAMEYANDESVRILNGKGSAQDFKCKGIRSIVREEDFAELTLDRECSAKDDCRATNPKRAGAGFKIINSKLGNCRSRGILVKADNGLIENNQISGCGMSAISIGPEFYWNEAGYCENVIVRGNTLRGNVANQSQCGVIFVHGDGAMGNRKIQIVGNTFDHNHGSPEIRLDWTDGATIQDNQFLLNPDKSKDDVIISLTESRRISFQNNRISNLTPDRSPVKIGNHVEEVTGNDAAGFQPLPAQAQ